MRNELSCADNLFERGYFNQNFTIMFLYTQNSTQNACSQPFLACACTVHSNGNQSSLWLSIISNIISKTKETPTRKSVVGGIMRLVEFSYHTKNDFHNFEISLPAACCIGIVYCWAAERERERERETSAHTFSQPPPARKECSCKKKQIMFLILPVRYQAGRGTVPTTEFTSFSWH